MGVYSTEIKHLCVSKLYSRSNMHPYLLQLQNQQTPSTPFDHCTSVAMAPPYFQLYLSNEPAHDPPAPPLSENARLCLQVSHREAVISKA